MPIVLDKVNFKNGRENPVLAEHFNNMQDNIQEAITTLEDKVASMPIGSGCDYFGTTAPENFMFADGSAVSRTDYAKLFEVIGTTYGAGDGTTTFNLPDKRERVSIMKGSNDTLGEKVGSNNITLTENNLPKVVIPNVVTNVKGNTSNTWDVSKTSPSITSIDQTKGSASFGFDTPTPIDNRQSSLICNYIIRVL